MSGTAALASVAVRNDALVEGLIRPMLQPAYRFAYMLLHDREAAEDAVQEAALKSWLKRAQLRPGADPKPWFFGFVANECRNARRLRWRSVLKVGVSADAPRAVEAHDVDLARAMHELPPRDRAVVLLHFYVDLSIDEIAVALHLRPAAVRSRLYRAVKRLRPRVELMESTDA